MAIQQIVQTTLKDDLDGSMSPDVATRTFAVGVQSYQIELSDGNWKDVLETLAQIIDKARPVKASRNVKVAARRSAKSPAEAAAQRELNKAIKAWAATQPGMEVKGRGAPSKAMTLAYHQAQFGSGPSVGEPVFVAPPEE